MRAVPPTTVTTPTPLRFVNTTGRSMSGLVAPTRKPPPVALSVSIAGEPVQEVTPPGPTSRVQVSVYVVVLLVAGVTGLYRAEPIVTILAVAFAVIAVGEITVAVLAFAAAALIREPAGKLLPETLRPTSVGWNVPVSGAATVSVTVVPPVYVAVFKIRARVCSILTLCAACAAAPGRLMTAPVQAIVQPDGVRDTMNELAAWPVPPW